MPDTPELKDCPHKNLLCLKMLVDAFDVVGDRQATEAEWDQIELPQIIGDYCLDCNSLVNADPNFDKPNRRAPQPDNAAATPEPAPNHSGPEIVPLVVSDLQARREAGIRKYGGPLTAHNGRDAMMDAYQEALGLCCYMRQAMEERKPDLADVAEEMATALKDLLDVHDLGLSDFYGQRDMANSALAHYRAAKKGEPK